MEVADGACHAHVGMVLPGLFRRDAAAHVEGRRAEPNAQHGDHIGRISHELRAELRPAAAGVRRAGFDEDLLAGDDRFVVDVRRVGSDGQG